MTLPEGTRLGPYEILAPLGAGGMGEVYQACDTRLNRNVAIKVLPAHLAGDAEALARFEREAKAVAALSHPNIMAIHDFGTSDGITYAVMELLEGQTLRERLSESSISPRKAVDYGRQMARGLAAAHERGIVHRDLKPENLFLTRDGLVKILDFGLATHVVPTLRETATTDAPTSEGSTEPGMVLGTVAYMSPEQARGRPVDQRSDLFSLGAVLFEMVSGQRAFRRASTAETMVAILQDDPPRLSRADLEKGAELERIILHCLEKNPEERFQSARDLAFALHALEEGASGQSGISVSTARLDSSGSRAAAAAQASIAVLPFRNMSPDPENEYFSDGMTEEIIDALTKIQTLHVAARTSSFAFKGKNEDIRQIGERLNVRTVLEGSVRRAGERLRITAQLVNVADGYHVWSEHYDRQMRDVFEVQEEIARSIAGALKLRLLPAEASPLVEPGTRDVEAYNIYLKGRYFFNQRFPRKAIERFEAAIARDPGFSAAYTGLADSYGIFGFYGGMPTLEAFARARAAATRAREIEPDSAEAFLSLGLIEHYFGWNLDQEEQHLKRSIELAPRSAAGYSWLGLMYGLLGRLQEGLPMARKGVELEPLSANAQTNVGWPLFIARRYDEALEEYRKASELDADAMYPLWSIGMCYQAMGAFEDAIAAFDRSVRATRRELTWPLALLGSAYAAAGRETEARGIQQELEEWSRREYVPPLHRVFLEIGLGETDAAFASLGQACSERNALCWWIRTCPVYDSLREDPRFPPLLESIRPA